ncbi:MAG: prepilin-type N-terminal cleavage/methylation domain-containing protein, partial [Cyanobacteria bacterium P01_H01_bin.58]
MAGAAYKFFLKRLMKQSKSLQQRGFTLLELLVAVIIGTLISSLLLFIVVELVRANRREEVLTQTQQSMQRAMDYVTRDLGEAVFVYAEPSVVTDELDDLPAGSVPVVAFWRLDPVDITQAGSGIDCDANNECTTLRVRQSSYTLVVYLLQANGGADIWEGPARIIRYTLPTYQDITTLTQTDGYQDPSVPPSSFENWEPTATATDGNAQV